MLNVVIYLLCIHCNAFHAVIHEAVTRISKKFNRMKVVKDHHRLKNIQLKIALRTAKTDSGVVAHHLPRHHSEGFTRCGVYLAGHDRRTRLIFWERKLSKTATRARSKPTNVVGDFHEGGGESLQSTAGKNDFVVSGKRGEFVGMRAERQAG